MSDKHCVHYSRRQLLSLYTTAPRPSFDLRTRIRSLGLWSVCRLKATRVRRYRGRRSGRTRRSPPTTRRLDNGAHVIVASRSLPVRSRDVGVRRPASLTSVHVDRHSASTGTVLSFSCLNIRSLTHKLDDLLEVRRDLSIDVMFLVET